MLNAVADGEKVTDRSIDTGDGAAVVVDPEPEQPGPAILVIGNRHPEVIDFAGAFKIRQNGCFAWNRPLAIVIGTPISVVGGDRWAVKSLSPRGERDQRNPSRSAAHSRSGPGRGSR